MRIVFIGPPGAGKGTQSQRLAQERAITHLSTGEVLREAQAADLPLGRKAAAYFETGRLVPDDVVVKLVADRLSDSDCIDGYLFDGFPRTVRQAQELDRLLAERDAPLHAALEFVIPEQELLKRLAKRGRSDDNLDTLRERLRVYAAETTPLAEYYEQRKILRRIDAVGAPDDVFARIESAIADLKGGS